VPLSETMSLVFAQLYIATVQANSQLGAKETLKENKIKQENSHFSM
jgi:hypothetical protein